MYVRQCHGTCTNMDDACLCPVAHDILRLDLHVSQRHRHDVSHRVYVSVSMSFARDILRLDLHNTSAYHNTHLASDGTCMMSSINLVCVQSISFLSHITYCISLVASYIFEVGSVVYAYAIFQDAICNMQQERCNIQYAIFRDAICKMQEQRCIT